MMVGAIREKAHASPPTARHRVQTRSGSGLPGWAKPVRLAKQHDVCRNLIRLWVKKYEAGEFDAEAEAARTLHEYQAKIAALEGKVGQLGASNYLRNFASFRRLGTGTEPF